MDNKMLFVWILFILSIISFLSIFYFMLKNSNNDLKGTK